MALSLSEASTMLRQVIILLALAAVALGRGDGRPFQSTKTVKTAQQQQQHQFASVTSYHANQPAGPQYQAAPQFQAAPQVQAQPSPYAFNYEAEGSARQESADASGKVTGSYTVTNEDGSVRVVKYIADDQGFRADIDTNEAGTKSSNPANVALKSAFVEPAAPAQAPKRYAAPVQIAPVKIAPQVNAYSGGQYEQTPMQYNLGSNGGAYSFNYQSQLEDGGSSSRSESSDGSGKVSGHYSLSVADGRRRQVDYSSGAEGFQAKIDTNEFGTKSDSPANVQFYSSAPQPAAPAATSYAQSSSFQQQKQVKTYAAAPIQQQAIQPATFAAAPIKQQPAQSYAQYDSKPSPYAFSYDAQLEDGSSSRTESADASGKVVGSYSLSTADGRQRTIHYTADHEGFRASVDTNEFGTQADSPADVQFNSNAPKQAPVSTYSAGQFSQQRIPAAFPAQQSQISSGSQTKSAFQSQASYQGQSAMQYNTGAEQYAPFAFNYVAEGEDGSSSRSESGDGTGKVVGSYSLSVSDGRKRTVDYLADQGGFRANINTNEHGTKSDSPADIQLYSSAPLEAPQAHGASAYKATTGQFQSGASAGHFQSGASSYKATTGQFQSGASAGQFQSGASAGQFQSGASAGQYKASGSAGQYKASGLAGGQYQASGSAGQYKASFASQQRVEAEPSYQPSPYSFGYQAEATGGSSARSESSDASGKVTGSYTVRNEDGSVRVVEYIADQGGFRANVKTNEPGTKSDDPAHVVIQSDAPAASAPLQQQQYAAKANFPARTYTPKTSEISQKNVEAWSR
ncbi:cuticle protein 10.9 [Trichonephila inaurata madagascariensis]|uniref:Cuticle protein 10.9 n=1 Tax=Trichonephila inaurata madagascariensis TaxID=2747483 RepID=A0A8X7BWP9_9ARAC|nr:cuticle protein 10.9 [Trichonephila inaurata madagascariensis]